MMSIPPLRDARRLSLLTVVALSTALAGCGGKHAAPAHAGPTPVSVVTLKARAVPITTDLPGRTVAYRVAKIVPQVSGIILKRLFTEGGDVKAGQRLYQIDPAPYQASYDSAKASLANAEAALKVATIKAQRYKPLAAAHAVSQLDLASAEATQQQDAANVAAAKAKLETARINLRYTQMRSPISGRVGRSSVTEGALVTSDQSSALTTVQQIDPIYVDATQPSNVLLRLEREYADGQLKKAGQQQAQVKLIFDDGSAFDETGKLQFSEVTVDQNTGSVTLRAVFPNPKHLLLPGMFVHLRIQEGIRENALLVPQQGITHDSAGHATALVVDRHDKVEQRTVTTSRAVGHDWLVTDGLKPGERVIVKGLQHVKPGDTVKPETADKNDGDGDKPASASSTSSHHG